MRTPTAVLLAALAAAAVAIGIAWGGKALVVFAFFAGIAALMAFAMGVGGRWLRDASEGRFDRRNRR